MKDGGVKVQLRTDIPLKLAITDVTPIFHLQSTKQTFGMLHNDITMLVRSISIYEYLSISTLLYFLNIFRYGFKEMLLLF